MERVAESAKQHEPSPAIAGHGRVASPAAVSLPPALELQQLAGNQAMQQLLRSGFLQAKLAMSNPDDPEEREADHVASTIMRKHAGAPCSCSPGEEMCEECQQKQSQPTISRRASAPAAPAHVPRIVSDVLRSPGHPLDSAARAFFEPRFGHDFSDVRVHTDSHAADSARSIHAHAYTAGSDIVFAPGQYSPATDAGRSLLAHELAHVVGGSRPHPRLYRHATGNPQAAPSHVSPTPDSPEDKVDQQAVVAAVDIIVEALRGVTTSFGSARILQQFQKRTAPFVRAMIVELKSRAPQNKETPDGMVEWLFKDLDEDDRASLRLIFLRLGVLDDLGPSVVQGIFKGLKGYTFESDIKNIVETLTNVAPFALDDILSQLEKAAGKSEPDMAEWLFGDLDRVSADILREHFFAVRSDRANRYAARFVAGKINSLLSGFLGIVSHSESSMVVRNFSNTPESARPLVQFFLDQKTTESSGKSAAECLMQKLDQEDYETLRKLSGVTLPEYQKESSWIDKLVSFGKWVYTVAQWLVCGLVGVVTGVLSAAWGLVKGIIDIGVIAPMHILGLTAYLLSGFTYGVEHWIAVRTFFVALASAVRHPINTFERLWNQLVKEYQTIEGPFTDCKRAEFIVRHIITTLVNIILIFVGGYGIAKGAYSAIRGAAEVAETAEILETGEGAAALEEGAEGGNVVDLNKFRAQKLGGGAPPTGGGAPPTGGGGPVAFRGDSAARAYAPAEVEPAKAPTIADVEPAEAPDTKPSESPSPQPQPYQLPLPLPVDALPKEPKKPKCGDPELPWTQVTPTLSDRGEKVVANPLTRCGPPGSSTDTSRFALPAWACVQASGKNDFWVHAHLLHGKSGAPDLHGPGDKAWNLILADKSINGTMYGFAEERAIIGTLQDQTFSYVVEPVHVADTGDRRYFAKGMKINLNRIDPVTHQVLQPIYNDTVTSGTNEPIPDKCT